MCMIVSAPKQQASINLLSPLHDRLQKFPASLDLAPNRPGSESRDLLFLPKLCVSSTSYSAPNLPRSKSSRTSLQISLQSSPHLVSRSKSSSPRITAARLCSQSAPNLAPPACFHYALSFTFQEENLDATGLPVSTRFPAESPQGKVRRGSGRISATQAPLLYGTQITCRCILVALLPCSSPPNQRAASTQVQRPECFQQTRNFRYQQSCFSFFHCRGFQPKPTGRQHRFHPDPKVDLFSPLSCHPSHPQPMFGSQHWEAMRVATPFPVWRSVWTRYVATERRALFLPAHRVQALGPTQRRCLFGKVWEHLHLPLVSAEGLGC